MGFSQSEIPLSDQPSLTQRSPFLPAGFDPEAKAPEKPRSNRAQANKTLEFRGVYQLLGEYRFLVKERSALLGSWVKLNDSSADFVVTNYDTASQTLTVEYEGTTHEVSLIALEGNPAPIPVNGQPTPPRVDPAQPTSPQVRPQVRPQIPIRNTNAPTNPNNTNPSVNRQSGPVRRPPVSPRFSNGSTPSTSNQVNASGRPGNPPTSGPPTGVTIPPVPDFIPPPPPSGPPPEPPPGLIKPTQE